MASKEIQDQVKKKLFEEWMPDKPGGLKGLINMAAEAALAVVGERVEFLEGELHAFENPGTEEGDIMTLVASEDIKAEDLVWLDSERGLRVHLPDGECDCAAVGGDHIEDCPKFVDQTQYRCPQCDVTHRRDSDVGTKHAHLFYGGTPAVVHLENCPVLEDPEATCNCNAIPASADQRAADRRPNDRV